MRDDAEAKATYKMNASMLNTSISQITKQLESQESQNSDHKSPEDD